MKFLLDHDVPAEITRLLHYWGHQVTVLRNVLPTTTAGTRSNLLLGVREPKAF